MRRALTWRRTAALCAILLACSSGLGFRQCGGTPSLRKQLVTQSDRWANAVKAAQGVNEDLFDHKKISAEQAAENTERLRLANSIHKRAHGRIEAWVKQVEADRRDAEARGEKWVDPGIPVSLAEELRADLRELEGALRDAGHGSDFAARLVTLLDIAAGIKELLDR